MEYEAESRGKIESSKDADIQEIINYRRAIGYAVEELKNRPLCLNLILDLHRILLDSVRGRNKAPGEFRRIQNYIGPPGCSIENATFVPPSVDLLSSSLDNWEKFLHYDEKDRLVQLAIAKAQFELIHPFLDGNGRIGRMLVPVFLYEKGLLSNPMFYLSAYLEEHRDIYYEKLRAISTKGDWNGWITFFLRAVFKQANENSRKTSAILALYEEMKQNVPAITRSQYAIQAIDTIFDQPIFQSTDFITRSKIPKDSALRILNALKKRKLLLPLRESRGRLPAILMFRRLIEITEGKG